MEAMKQKFDAKELPLADHEARKIVEAVERNSKRRQDPSVHVACAWAAALDAMLCYLTDRGYDVTASPDLSRITWSKAKAEASAKTG